MTGTRTADSRISQMIFRLWLYWARFTTDRNDYRLLSTITSFQSQKHHSQGPPTHFITTPELPHPKTLINLVMRIIGRVNVDTQRSYASITHLVSGPKQSCHYQYQLPLDLAITFPSVFNTTGKEHNNKERPQTVNECLNGTPMYNMDFRLICGVGTRRRVHYRKCGRSHCCDQHGLEKRKIEWCRELVWRWLMKDKDSERLRNSVANKQIQPARDVNFRAPNAELSCVAAISPTLNLPVLVLVLACRDFVPRVFSFTGLLSTRKYRFGFWDIGMLVSEKACPQWRIDMLCHKNSTTTS